MFKRGFSLYSFQEELFLGQMTVEDCVAFGASIGAHGVELLPEQNMPDFPTISDAKVAAGMRCWPSTAPCQLAMTCF